MPHSTCDISFLSIFNYEYESFEIDNICNKQLHSQAINVITDHQMDAGISLAPPSLPIIT